jgi:hypothetical protein
MRPGISTFMNLPTPIKVGVLLVSGGGIMAAIYYIFPRLFWVVFVGIAIVALLLVLYWRLLKWLKKRKAAPMERGVIDNTSTTPQGVSAAAHVARLDDLRKKFEDGIEKFHAAGKSLYNFPWYMIVGEPGSGKTEAIRHCNIGFPPGLQDQFQGAGGTMNMNWWFTDHAVVLDTAGRLMFEEVETGGSSEWKEFLKLLKQYRPRCPMNGVFLVIPADSLIKDTADEIEQKASKIARQFDVIQRILDVRFPVFVVITKSDLLNGFRDFFDNLTDPQLQHQILGWSNPAPLDEPYNPDFVNQHLKTIQGRLFRRRLALLQEVVSDEPAAEQTRASDTLYAFPHSLAKIAPRMARYLELIFSVGSQWSCKPLFFRGIYFTSSMREGSALDEDLAESLGVSVDSLPDGRVWERDRAYFLRDLFMKKVFREKGLVTYATNAKKLHGRRKAVVLISAIASVILLLFFTIFYARSFSTSIGDLEKYLGPTAKLIESQGDAGLRVVQRKADEYRYTGRASVLDKPEDLNRVALSAKLAETVAKYNEKGVPWIFGLAQKFSERIDRQQLQKAQAVIYEAGVLGPFLDETRHKIAAQENGQWRRIDPEAQALRQLIRIEAGREWAEEDGYSNQTLLDPLFTYVFKPEEPNAGQEEADRPVVRNYNEDKRRLHAPLSAIYGGLWPPATLKGGAAGRKAIEKGVGLFNDYWLDPNRISVGEGDFGQADAIKKLESALAAFDDAEAGILSLPTRFSLQPKTILGDVQWKRFADDWSRNFARLEKAVADISNSGPLVKDIASLEELWAKEASKAQQQIDDNYDFLLDELPELKDVNEAEFLFGVRKTLEDAKARRKKDLSDSKFATRLKSLDSGFWRRMEGGRLYEIRFRMYSAANGQFGTAPGSAAITKLANLITQVRDDAAKGRQVIQTQLSFALNAHRQQNAFDISRQVLGLGEHRRLYGISRVGLTTAPDSPEKLETLIEKDSNWDWASVPADIVGKERFDPNAARDVLAGWTLLGKTVRAVGDQVPESEAAWLSKRFEDLNDVYAKYPDKWLDFWLGTVPESMVAGRVASDSKQLAGLLTKNVFDWLLKDAGEPIEKAVTLLDPYLPRDSTRKERFQSSMREVKERPKYRIDECSNVLDNWSSALALDPVRARDTLLKSQPRAFLRDYMPFSYESSSELANMYWTELTYALLGRLSEAVQTGSTEALRKLKVQYGAMFPLERESAANLSAEQLIQSASLVDQIMASKYDAGTVGGSGTRIAQIDERINRLSQTKLDVADSQWITEVGELLKGLPRTQEPYYCKIELPNAAEQGNLVPQGEQLMLGHLNYVWVGQGDTVDSSRKRREMKETRSREDLVVKVLSYPGPPVKIEFYAYPSDPTPSEVRSFSEPWACLRLLAEHDYSGKKGYVKLKIDKGQTNLGGVLFLRLKFYKDRDCTKYPVELPQPNRWPSLKGKV